MWSLLHSIVLLRGPLPAPKGKGKATAPASGASGAPSSLQANPIAAEEEQIDQRSAGNTESIGSAHGCGGGAGTATRAPAAPPVESAPAAASATVQRRLTAPYMTRSTFSEDTTRSTTPRSASRSGTTRAPLGLLALARSAATAPKGAQGAATDGAPNLTDGVMSFSLGF
mgnify:CR=1 FL=1